MMEDAAALCGRNGLKDMSKSEETAIEHAELVDGGGLSENPNVAEDQDVVETGDSEPIHTAAPELAHAGESRSNGLAEKAVGIC